MQRWFEGRSVEVVHDGTVVRPEIKRLGVRTSDPDRLVPMQNGNDIHEVQDGEMDPDGHLSIVLNQEYQSATADDLTALNGRLDRIERYRWPGDVVGRLDPRATRADHPRAGPILQLTWTRSWRRPT